MAKPGIACLLVQTPASLEMLGDRTVLEHTLDQLEDVRGVREITCCVSTSIHAKTLKALKGRITSVTPIKPVGPVELDRWLLQRYDAQALLVVEPVCPFIPAAKMEACLNAVLRGKATSCILSRAVNALALPMLKTASLKLAVRSVRALSKTTAPTLHAISVNLVESLNIENHDEFVLASALHAAQAA